MKLTRRVLGVFVVFTLVAAGAAFAAEDQPKEKIPLYEVPIDILKAAAKVVPGMSFEDAWREVKKGVTIYELQGPAPDGEVWSVEVTAEGEVLEFGKASEKKDKEG